MKYIYCVWGENEAEDYIKNNIWSKTNVSSKIRSYPFKISALQAMFSIRSLRMFDEKTLVEIYTNQPDSKFLKSDMRNIKIINAKVIYDKFIKTPYWQYKLKIVILKDQKEDYVAIDTDTYFFDTPVFNLRYDVCYVNTVDNTGVFGLTAITSQKIMPIILEKSMEEWNKYKGTEKRCMDQEVSLEVLQKFNIKKIDTTSFIHHYWDMKDENTLFNDKLLEFIRLTKMSKGKNFLNNFLVK